MSVSMLSKKSTKLAPNIIKIQYQFIKNVSSVKLKSNNFITVNFCQDYNFTDLYFTPGTANYKEPSKKVIQGLVFNQELTFKVPGELSDSLDELNKLDVFPVIIRIEYNNGVSKLIGSLKMPALFKNSTSNIFSFFCKTTHRAYLIE